MERVLIIAYACEPGKGSEPSVGWNWALQVSKNFETWVITRKSNRKAIENFILKNPVPTLRFEYVDLPRWAIFWKKSEFSIRLYYMIWQVLAFVKVFRLHRKIGFHIIHHITFLVDWLPPLAAFLPSNFVWGPIGGTSRELLIPFFKEFGFKNSLYEIFRSAYLNLFTFLNPLIHLAKKRAKAILISIEEEKEKNPEEKVFVVPAIGISPAELKCKNKKFSEFTIFITGRMVHWKGFSLAIKAFSVFLEKFPDARLLVGGKGPEEKKLKKMVERLGLKEKVSFLGFLPSRDDVLRVLSQSHIFLLPTLRDAPLVSFLEAMGCGTPVVCIDTPSQRSLVCDKCGIRVRREKPEKLVNDLAEALYTIAQNPRLAEEMGRVAKDFALNNFSWEKKGEIIKKIYRMILEGHENISGS